MFMLFVFIYVYSAGGPTAQFPLISHDVRHVD